MQIYHQKVSEQSLYDLYMKKISWYGSNIYMLFQIAIKTTITVKSG